MLLLDLLVVMLLELGFTPRHLEIIALSREVIHGVLAIPPQHADGQEDQQDQDESSGNWNGDGGGFQPQVLGCGVTGSRVDVSVQSRFHGNRPEFQTHCTTNKATISKRPINMFLSLHDSFIQHGKQPMLNEMILKTH